MKIAEKIYQMIIAEGGTLFHSANRTFIVPIYGYSLTQLLDEKTRTEAHARFTREIASRELRELIVAHRAELAKFCADRRAGLAATSARFAAQRDFDRTPLGSSRRPRPRGPIQSGAGTSDCHDCKTASGGHDVR